MTICKRLFLFFLSLYICNSSATAEPVDGDTARTAALSFMNMQQIHPAGKTAKSAAVSGSECIFSRDGDVIAHVVNLEPEGYVITSADTRIKPVLGYSPEGRFEGPGFSDDVLSFLIRYDMDNRYRSFGHGNNTAGNEEQWRLVLSDTAVHKTVQGNVWGPLIHEYWNQRDPYNVYCPVDTVVGRRSKAGCSAIAVAMVFNYWQYPRSLHFDENNAYVSEGSNGDISIPEDSEKYDFPGFDELNDHLANIAYNGDVDELAWLLFGVGIKVQSRYSYLETAAYIKTDIFKENGYPNAKQMWDDPNASQIVIDNMKRRCPVVMAVYDSNDENGHAAVFDGYDENTGMFHINFGWGNIRNSNFWYDIEVLDFRGLTTIRGLFYDLFPDEQAVITTFAGSVTDIYGEPVENASVSVDGRRYRTLTDSAGQFSIDVLDGSGLDITIQKTGYAVHRDVLTSGPVMAILEPSTDPTLAYYHFDGDARDASGRDNDFLVNMDESRWVDGKYGQALEMSPYSLLSGMWSEMSYPGTGDLTAEGWVQITGFGECQVLIFYQQNDWLDLWIDEDDKAKFLVMDDGGAVHQLESPSLADRFNVGDFIHLAGVYRENGGIQLYVNGRMEAEEQGDYALWTSPYDAPQIGKSLSFAETNLPMVMDEFRLTYDELQPGEFIGSEFVGTLDVAVTDTQTGEVPEGIIAILEPGGYRAEADDNGHAVFTGIPARDDYALTVQAPDYMESVRDTVNVLTGETTAVSMALTPEVGVAEERQTAFSLSAPWPNPFNAGVTIQYEIPREGDVRLTVFNVIGQTVFSDFKSQAAAGTHTVHWSAENIPDGLYVVRVSTGDHSSVRKIMHVK